MLKNAEKYDYEAELIVIIGKEARIITEEPPNYIFGYTIGDSLSTRDLQFKIGQWLLGKMLDGVLEALREYIELDV